MTSVWRADGNGVTRYKIIIRLFILSTPITLAKCSKGTLNKKYLPPPLSYLLSVSEQEINFYDTSI